MCVPLFAVLLFTSQLFPFSSDNLDNPHIVSRHLCTINNTPDLQICSRQNIHQRKMIIVKQTTCKFISFKLEQNFNICTDKTGLPLGLSTLSLNKLHILERIIFDLEKLLLQYFLSA